MRQFGPTRRRFVQAVAPRYRFKPQPIEVRLTAEMAPAVQAAVRNGSDAVILVYRFAAGLGAASALQAGLPAISHHPSVATSYGGLFAFGVSYTALHRRAATYRQDPEGL